MLLIYRIFIRPKPNNFIEFEKTIKTKKSLNFLDLTKSIVDKYTNWLINTQKYSVNYSGKMIDNLKTVSLDAKKNEIQVNPYVKNISGFTESNEDRYIVTLSFDELEKIRNTNFESKSLENAKNWLLIGCEIGQRGSDLLNITYDNIRYNNNNLYLDIVQQKTGKSVTIGVVAPHIIDILENNIPYNVSVQKLNTQIKKVCQIAEIDEVIMGKKINKLTKRKELKEYPKYELITSHSFRRSFATNYYKKIPTAILINITAHSKESLFLEYINQREDKDANADLFMKFYNDIHKDKEPQLKVVRNA
jgi:integrase